MKKLSPYIAILAAFIIGIYVAINPTSIPPDAAVPPAKTEPITLSTPYVTNPEALRAESGGHSIIDADLKHYFDFLLTSSDGMDVIQVRAETAFAQHLPAQAKQETTQLWHQYLDYLHLFSTLDAKTNPNNLFSTIQLLREQTIGKAESQAFFADEINLETKWLEPSANPETLLKTLPGVGSAIVYFVQNSEITARFNAEQLHAFSTELAKQQKYERYKTDPISLLNQRYYEYLGIKEKILSWDLNQDQRQALIQDYLNQHFSQHELIRVKELDKVHSPVEK